VFNRFGQWLSRVARSPAMPDLRDALVFGGIGVVGYGIVQIHEPAAWIVVGAALVWLGVRSG
jgi:hypothetical protein